MVVLEISEVVREETTGWKDLAYADSFRRENFLFFNHVGRCRTFLAGNHIKADAVSLLEGFESGGLDRRMMDEDILATILLNETKPL